MRERGDAGDTAQITPVGSIILWVRKRWAREPSDDEHAAIDELIPQGGDELAEYVVRFSFLIVLSASIAGFGLLADSAGVVIGAMLVAPLMTPITAVAGSSPSSPSENSSSHWATTRRPPSTSTTAPAPRA